MTMTASPLHRVVPGQRLVGDQPATPRQDDPTNTRGTQATRARSPRLAGIIERLPAVESNHRRKDSATTPRGAGHRIKSFEPLPLDSAPMSPRRLGPRRSTFNYFEDTVEMAPTA
jgi:hypothetical protein